MQSAAVRSLPYEYPERADQRQAQQKKTQLKVVRSKERRRIFSVSNVLIYLIVMAVSAFIVYNYMHVSMLADQKAKLENQLEKLKTEETSMLTRQEQMFSLANVETYAQEQLGMVKADKSVIEYIELSNPDTVRILKDGEEKTGEISEGRLAHSLNIVVEFLN